MNSDIDPQLPLIDLHRHLNGSVRLETILDLGRQHNLSLPAWDLERLRPHVQITEAQPGIMTFVAKFKWMTATLVDCDACERVGYENLLDAKNEGIDYIELRFSPLFMAQAHGLDPAGISAAVATGVQRGVAGTGVKASLIGILSRHFGLEKLRLGCKNCWPIARISLPWTWPAKKPVSPAQCVQLAFLSERDKLELLNRERAAVVS